MLTRLRRIVDLAERIVMTEDRYRRLRLLPRTELRRELAIIEIARLRQRRVPRQAHAHRLD